MSKIIIKNSYEIELIKKSAQIVSKTLGMLANEIKPGINSIRLDKLAENFIRDHGAKPGFLGLYDFPNTLCVSPNSEVVHGTMLPNDKNESYESLLAYLNEENKEKIKEADLSRILHMIEVKSHACSKPTFEQCTCPTTTYKNQLLIQSHNLEQPEKSLTFALDFVYTENGVIFDENNINIIPMEKSINTGKWDDDKFDISGKDSPYI